MALAGVSRAVCGGFGLIGRSWAQGELLAVGPQGEGEDLIGLLGVDGAFNHAGGVPRLDRPCLARGVERRAVARVDQAGDRPLVGEDRVDELPARAVNVPDADALVHAARGELLAAGVPGDRVEPVGRFAERVEPRPGRGVPHLDGTVRGGGGEQLAVGAERQAEDRVAVVLERVPLLAGARVPEFDQLVVAARREQLAVGAERHVEDEVFVGVDPYIGLADRQSARRDEVDAEFARGSRRAAGDREPVAVAAERERSHLRPLTGELADEVLGRHVEEGDLAVAARGEELAAGVVGERGHRGGGRNGRLDIGDADRGWGAGVIVLGARGDPGADDGDLVRLGVPLGVLRRHDGALLALDELQQQALIRLARDDDRAELAALLERRVALDVQAAFHAAGVMALQAVAGEERLDVLGVARRLRAGRRCGQQEGDQRQDNRSDSCHGAVPKSFTPRSAGQAFHAALCRSGFPA